MEFSIEHSNEYVGQKQVASDTLIKLYQRICFHFRQTWSNISVGNSPPLR